MAKVNRGPVTLSGKLGQEVHVDGRYGRYVRRIAQGSSQRVKKNPEMRRQHQRTAFLNEISSEVNHIVHLHARELKSSAFYHAVQKKLRKEPQNMKGLLLMQLKGMEVHPAYPLSTLGDSRITVTNNGESFGIQLEILFHPRKRRNLNANCYQYDLVLITWTKYGDKAHYEQQYTDWIYLNEGRVTFEFLFDKPRDTMHWVLCQRGQFGLAEVEIGTLASQGMRIVDVGTFDKNELAILEARLREQKELDRKRAMQPEVKRVVGRRG